jgi:thiol-disulfide isomerase/thioredoxin
MKRISMSLAILAILGLNGSPLAATIPPAKGGTLPAFSLPIPKDSSEKTYLGLSGDGPFKVPQIKAEVVLIEVFSLYCPYCQSSAPGLNELYQLIENNPETKGKIKMIGIGAGNSAFEVETFRKTYNVLFPLFPDKDFAIHKALGDVRTPYFIAIKIKADRTHEVIHSELGGFAGAQAYLEVILKASGLAQGGKP